MLVGRAARPCQPMRSRPVAVSVLLVLSAGCGGGGGVDGQAGGGGTTTTAAAATTSSTARPIDYHRHSAPTEVATGLLEGTSPDGRSLYVTAVDPSLSRRGCEGQLEPILFRVPLAGGNHQVLGPPGEPVRGTILRGAERNVALVAGCEEFLSAVRVGTETPDGQLRDLRRLDLAQLRNVSTMSWSGDGRTLLAVSRSESPGGRSSILRVDPASGGSTPLFTLTGPVSQVGQLAEGTFVVAGGGRVTLRDGAGAVKQSVDGVGFTVAPDRRRLAVWGKALRLVAPGEPDVTLATVAATTDLLGPAEFSPDGRALTYTTSVQENGSVAVVTMADKKVTTVPGPGRYVRLFFTGDGRAVAFSRLATRPADEGPVLVVRFQG